MFRGFLKLVLGVALLISMLSGSANFAWAGITVDILKNVPSKPKFNVVPNVQDLSIDQQLEDQGNLQKLCDEGMKKLGFAGSFKVVAYLKSVGAPDEHNIAEATIHSLFCSFSDGRPDYHAEGMLETILRGGSWAGSLNPFHYPELPSMYPALSQTVEHNHDEILTGWSTHDDEVTGKHTEYAVNLIRSGKRMGSLSPAYSSGLGQFHNFPQNGERERSISDIRDAKNEAGAKDEEEIPVQFSSASPNQYPKETDENKDGNESDSKASSAAMK